VFTKDECTVQGTHAVTLIGWGTDPKSKKNYWLIKNSFGMDWGEGGLLRVERKQNICLIKKYITYPVIN
jgi:C1A family cysteine protease